MERDKRQTSSTRDQLHKRVNLTEENIEGVVVQMPLHYTIPSRVYTHTHTHTRNTEKSRSQTLPQLN